MLQQLNHIKPGTNSSFRSLKQIDAGVLNVGYAEDGPVDGPAVILLHGWPYDIHTYVEVAPLLASAGYRVIVPYLRKALVPLHYPTGRGAQTAAEFSVNPAYSHQTFVADLPAAQAAVMAATQRPIAELAFSEPWGTPAWKTLPA